MQITETKSEGLSREYKVSLSANEIAEKVDLKLADIQRTAQLPGFRPGKVPATILKKRFGQSILGEVLEKAVGDSSQQALTEKGVRPAMQPEIKISEGFEEGKDLEYTIIVETLPEIKLTDFSKIEIERLTPETKDEDVEKALENLAKANQTSEPIKTNRKSKIGDVLSIDFVGTVDGKEFPGGKADDYPLELGTGSFIPGFEDQLVGVNANSETLVDVTFPESYGAKDLAGKSAQFNVKIKEIRETTPASIDDELAKKAGMDNLDALKSAIKEEQSREYVNLARGRAKRLLLDELFDQHDFDVPKKMVENELDVIFKQYEEQQKNKEGTDDIEDQKSEEHIKEEFQSIALRRVQLGLILAEVGRQNNIQIAQDDINRALMEEARNYPGQEEKVLNHFKENPQALESITAPLYEEKVADFILELAQVDEKKVPVAKFIEILEKDKKEQEAADSIAKMPTPKKKSTRKKSSGKSKKT
ncbi:MAG: trigger factor [Magnetovibrio sp.]|nr:trigger factor [Magnetovibrio sp.]